MATEIPGGQMLYPKSGSGFDRIINLAAVDSGT